MKAIPKPVALIVTVIGMAACWGQQASTVKVTSAIPNGKVLLVKIYQPADLQGCRYENFAPIGLRPAFTDALDPKMVSLFVAVRARIVLQSSSFHFSRVLLKDRAKGKTYPIIAWAFAEGSDIKPGISDPKWCAPVPIMMQRAIDLQFDCIAAVDRKCSELVLTLAAEEKE